MKPKYVRDDNAGGDTSFHGVELEASLEKMTAVFGKPSLGESKTLHEWDFKGPNGDITVYDYKYNGAIEKYWHVGGKNEAACVAFVQWAMGQLRKG